MVYEHSPRIALGIVQLGFQLVILDNPVKDFRVIGLPSPLCFRVSQFTTDLG